MRILLFPLKSSRIFYVLRAFGAFFCFCLALNTQAFTLTCPDDYVITLPPGSCGVEIYYDSVSFNSAVPLTDTVFYPFPGTFLETGITVVTLATVNINGDMATCTFSVTILASNATNLNCPSQSSISLLGQCSRLLTPQDVLGPNSNPCPGDYLVQRLNESNVPIGTTINSFDIGQPFNVLLTNLTTGSTCMTEITVTGGTPSAITCPEEVVIFCNTPTNPDITGLPELTGCYEDVTLSYTDEVEITFCPDTFAYQILRTWVSTDPYGKQDACQQFITAKRFDPTPVVFPPDFDGTQQPPLLCSDSLTWVEVASTNFTGVPLFEGFPAGGGFNCKIAVSYLDFETQLCGASYEIKRAWKVVKVCPPSFTLLDTQLIRVVDILPPQFKLPDSIFISLSSDCADSLFLPAVNVTAECSAYDMVIETPWDTLTTNGGVIHFDTIPGTYPVRYVLTDECGNQAIKNVSLIIENETLVSCPPDDTISCNLYFDSLAFALASSNNALVSAFLGNAVYHSNCDFVLAEIDSFEVNTCGTGFIQRKIFNLNAEEPFSCIQNITVVHVSNFEVLFPQDISICTDPATTPTGTPILFQKDCENTVVSFEDQIVASGYPGCYTINREWTVVNTCIYDENIEFPDEEISERRFRDGGDGLIQFTQIIQVNTSTPAFTNGCEMPDINLDQNSCEATVTVPSPAVTGCENLTLSVSGSLGSELGATQELEAGTYNVIFQVTDECGHATTCSTQFEVFDTNFPTAVCKNGVVVEISPTGITQLSATELDDGSFDNCSNLTFSFLPDVLSSSRTFTCDDLCLPPHEVTLWVTDPSGNQDFCETVVVVQNTIANCAACEINLSGMIKTEENEAISNVEVRFSASGFADTLLAATGVYQQPVPAGGDYTISAFKNNNLLNGVSTFDLVLIQRHILGTTPLGSPYKIIAADVNKSNSVTTFDLVTLRRLILFVETQLQNNTSWRFVPAAFSFPNPANPFQTQFPEVILVNDVNENVPNLNFIGIKTGDVNGSASPDPLLPNDTGIIDH